MREEFSASNLVKMDCQKLCAFRKGSEEVAVTDLMLKGNEYAKEVTKSEYAEMEGIFYSRKGSPISIKFSIDEVQIKDVPGRDQIHRLAKIIEHKMVSFDPNKDYFQKALLQTAFYKSLLIYSDKKLATADYYDGPKHELNLTGCSLFSTLNFGGTLYNVDCDEKRVMKFFVAKARASLSFITAEEFDEKNPDSWEAIGGKNVIKVNKISND